MTCAASSHKSAHQSQSGQGWQRLATGIAAAVMTSSVMLTTGTSSKYNFLRIRHPIHFESAYRALDSSISDAHVTLIPSCVDQGHLLWWAIDSYSCQFLSYFIAFGPGTGTGTTIDRKLYIVTWERFQWSIDSFCLKPFLNVSKTFSGDKRASGFAVAHARPEGVNKPDLLPKGDFTTVIDVAGFLTDGEVQSLFLF